MVNRGSYAFCVASTTRKTPQGKLVLPIRNPDKPSRRSDEGGSGTPLAVTLQSLVWDEDYPSEPERGNLREKSTGPHQRRVNFVLRRIFDSPRILVWPKITMMSMTSRALRNH